MNIYDPWILYFIIVVMILIFVQTILIFFVLFMMIAGRSIMSGVFIFCFQTLILTLFVCGRIVKFHFFYKNKIMMNTEKQKFEGHIFVVKKIEINK